MLDINLTMSIVEILGMLMNKLGQDSSFWIEGMAKEKALTDQNELFAHGQFFYTIENMLGYSIKKIYLDLPNASVDAWQLGPGQKQMFSYQQLQDKISASSLKKGLSNGITEEVQAPIKLYMEIEGYEPVKDLQFENLGVRGFLLKAPGSERGINCALEILSKDNIKIIRIETGKVCMNNTSQRLVLKCGDSEHELEADTS